MRLFITGATGTIGRRLLLERLAAGDEVRIVSRNAAAASAMFKATTIKNLTVLQGDPTSPGPWQDAIDGCDGVVHLAGAPIAGRRWTPAYKRLLRQSRIDSTFQVVEGIRNATHRPTVLISGSAAGFYGRGGEAWLDEESESGRDGLAALCRDWETQAMRAADLCRVVCLRSGIVLDPSGGALAKMLPLFRWGVGGPIGAGYQWMPWIAWQDLVAMIDWALTTPSVRGPLNATSPKPVSSRDLAKELGRAIHRPAVIPAPWLALRVVMGEVATPMCASLRVSPRKAISEGFVFHLPELARAMPAVLSGDRSMFQSAQSDHNFPLDQPLDGVKLVAFDLDGAIGDDDLLPPSLEDRIAAFAKRSISVAIATRRTPTELRTLLEGKVETGFALACDGAAAVDLRDGSIPYTQAIPATQAAELWRAIAAAAPGVIGHVDHSRGTIRCAGGVEDGAIIELCKDRPILRLSITGPPSALHLAYKAIQAPWQRREIALLSDHLGSIDILHPMSDRGVAIQEVARGQGIPQSATVAIAGTGRSAGLLEWSGIAVGVAGSPQAIQDLAQLTTSQRGRAGVEEIFDRLLLAAKAR